MHTFFDQLEIKIKFPNQDSVTWEQYKGFKKRLSIEKELHVVNNIVETGVVLIEDYNGLKTINEDLMQFLLQIMEQYRQSFPNCSKITLLTRWLK